MFEQIKKMNLETQIESRSAWVGSPDEIRRAIAEASEIYGTFEHASLQINFGMMPFDKAMASLKLFGTEVMPQLAAAA